MKENRWKAIVIPGVICVLALIVSVWYSVKFNESRLVVPMDFKTYEFSPKDLPMVCSVVLTIAYIWYLLICLGKTSIQQKKTILETNRTRRLNPKLGFLGFFGFLGFLDLDLPGFWLRFIFFGFFGFFYEGKMSATLMDERFRDNKNRAQLMALKTAFVVIIIALLFLYSGEYFNFMSTEYLYRVGSSLIALSIALAMFLSEYLLYRYDHDECSADKYIDNSDEEYDKCEHYSEGDMKE